jgi:RNA polymerase sigma factor (sigma-70 family)
MLTDEEVVTQVQAGQAELFEIIFDRHYGRIERYVRGLGLPDADLEDVVSETFIRAFARVRSFDRSTGTRYLSYLYAIARNLCTDRIRERMRTPEATFIEADEVADLPDEREEGSPLAALLKREQLDRIRAALAMLTPSDQEIIALSYERDLSCKEIMEVMQKPSVTAVTTHLYKAIKKLRTLVLAEEAGAPHDAGSRPSAARRRARPLRSDK